MFLTDSNTDEEGGLLKSARIFLWGKRRINATGRDICSATRRGDYKLVPHLYGESCDEEKEYWLISEEGEEVLYPYHSQEYEIPTNSCTSLA